MSEENKARYREFIEEVINKKNVGAINQYIAAEFTENTPPPGIEVSPGREGMTMMINMLATGFPDSHATIDLLVAEGDLVVGRMTTTGTHAGDFMGMPASGKSFSMSEIHIIRMVNGMAVEHWGNSDDMSMMMQLGAMPTP